MRALVRYAAVAWAALLLAPLAPARLAAQNVADVDPFHWAYAPAFGSGVYRLSDGTEARIARAPFRKWLREPRRGHGPDTGIRLLLPVTAGVQNLDDERLPPGRPADEVEHAAFLPGVELEFPGERWTLRTRAQLGWGTELEGAERSAVTAAAGLRSRFRWPDAAGAPALISGLQWVGFDADDAQRRSLLRFTQALEFDVPVPGWQFRDETMHLMPHVLADWYYRPPEWLAAGDGGFERVETEWQVGLAAGRETGFSILWFDIDSIGVAYRFSEHRDGIRFYIGSVF